MSRFSMNGVGAPRRATASIAPDLLGRGHRARRDRSHQWYERNCGDIEDAVEARLRFDPVQRLDEAGAEQVDRLERQLAQRIFGLALDARPHAEALLARVGARA